MRDINGNKVKVGDVVTLLYIWPPFLEKLPDDERPVLEGLINKDHVIKELVENDTKIGIYYEQECQEGMMCGTLYVEPTDIRLCEGNENEN
jgi:hypothetical protein